MARRKPLNYNSKELAETLRESTGRGVDALFPQQPTAPTTTKLEEGPGEQKLRGVTEKKQGGEFPTPRPKVEKKKKETEPDTTMSRHHDPVVETIRQRVKEIGKEAATYRFTVEEKSLLRAAIRRYEDRGIKTSENVLARIAINRLLRQDKDFLDEALKALYS